MSGDNGLSKVSRPGDLAFLNLSTIFALKNRKFESHLGLGHPAQGVPPGDLCKLNLGVGGGAFLSLTADLPKKLPPGYYVISTGNLIES